jgi:hypothetical protein
VDIDRWIRAGQEFFLDDLVKLKTNRRQYCVHELARGQDHDELGFGDEPRDQASRLGPPLLL